MISFPFWGLWLQDRPACPWGGLPSVDVTADGLVCCRQLLHIDATRECCDNGLHGNRTGI
jgi:hypothetical protein